MTYDGIVTYDDIWCGLVWGYVCIVSGGGGMGDCSWAARVQEQAEAKARIQREVAILSQVSHPGIVQYFESFEEDGCFFIAMEYAGGMTLQDRIASLEARGCRFTEDEVWQILIQLCLALRYLHQDKMMVSG